MLTNALRSNSPLRFERTAQFTKRHQAVILPIGGSAEVGGRTALGANKVGVRKVQLGAPHPLVTITPGDRFRRRMVRSTGMTAEIVQETGSERIEYRFKAPVHLLILFERGVRREGETAIAGLPGSSLRDLARKFVFVPAGHEYRDWREPSTPARVALFYFDSDELPGVGDTGAIALQPRLFFEDPHLFATAQKLIGLTEGAEPDNSCYIEALGRVLAHEAEQQSGRGWLDDDATYERAAKEISLWIYPIGGLLGPTAAARTDLKEIREIMDTRLRRFE